MGLSGRKVKQKIGNDPRNLSWADDAARFGSNYLAKFGWDSSKGLGASGEGRTSHIGVSQKLDMLGIGASQQRDPNGIAWKQNKDFENLLKRMNGDSSIEEIEGFSKAEEPNEKEMKKRKRKKDDQVSKKKKNHKKKKTDEVEDVLNTEDVPSIQLPDESTERRVAPIPPRHRAHRARAISAKTISSKSAGHISEILGIAPSPSSYTPVSSISNHSTPKSSSNDTDLETITTSAKTVGDYFKEKLKTKYPKSVDWDSTCSEPRGGLGSSSRAGLGKFLDVRN